MKPRSLLVTVSAVAVLASACGGASSTSTQVPSRDAPASSTTTGMHDMTAEEMAGMSGPSAPASMICSDEIRTAVRRTFGLARQPSRVRAWSPQDLTLTCTYQLPGGRLRMSVHDSPDDRSGRPFFDRLRRALPGATVIRGVESLGFPALETHNGTIAFLKDGKTLQVDATDISTDSLPAGLTRQQAAYGVAAAVIACWTE